MNYRMQCSCGHALYRGAGSREEAVEKFKAVETQDAINQHMATYHKGEPAITVAQAHAMIEQSVTTADQGLKLTYAALTPTA